MAKMLWEVNAPIAIAKAKEDMSVGNIYKYLRYYRMFKARVNFKYNDEDYSDRINNLLFWRGCCALVKDLLYGLVVCEIDETKSVRNPNGKLVKVSVSAENGYKRKDLEVGKDCVILYADETKYAPVLYIWAIANEIIDREDIIKTQDNMLRKPIIVTGEGEELDNAFAKIQNILSGVQWFNLKPKTKGSSNVLFDKPAEVLNLQVGNAYKGAELWASRKNFEELICDYLGYTTTKNEKRERMNTLEVKNENSVGMTFYKSFIRTIEKGLEDAKKIGLNIELEKILEEEEVKDDKDSQMERVSNEDR